MVEMSKVEIEKQIEKLRNRDSLIAIGISEKMKAGMFDNEEQAYFYFLEAYYLVSC